MADEETNPRDSSMREKAYALIQRKIATGELRAGYALSELALAKDLHSSRTPVREAIGQLVAEGLLIQAPNRGAFVKQITRQDIIDLFELREALESYAAAKAAHPPPRPADMERLKGLTAELLNLRDDLAASGARTLDGVGMHRFVSCDLAFHTVLMRMASNLRILKSSTKRGSSSGSSRCGTAIRARRISLASTTNTWRSCAPWATRTAIAPGNSSPVTYKPASASGWRNSIAGSAKRHSKQAPRHSSIPFVRAEVATAASAEAPSPASPQPE